MTIAGDGLVFFIALGGKKRLFSKVESFDEDCNHLSRAISERECPHGRKGTTRLQDRPR